MVVVGMTVVVVGAIVVVVVGATVVVVTTGVPSSSSSRDFFTLTIAGLLAALSRSPAIAVNQQRCATTGVKSTVTVALSSRSLCTWADANAKLCSTRALTPSTRREQSMRYDSADASSSHVATIPVAESRAANSFG